MTAIGKKINEFGVPVCNIFGAKVHNDQLCYEVNLELLKERFKIEEQLRDGLFLVLDYNEDRQFVTKDHKKEFKNEIRRYFLKDEDDSVQIHLDTLGIANVHRFTYIHVTKNNP